MSFTPTCVHSDNPKGLPVYPGNLGGELTTHTLASGKGLRAAGVTSSDRWNMPEGLDLVPSCLREASVACSACGGADSMPHRIMGAGCGGSQALL